LAHDLAGKPVSTFPDHARILRVVSQGAFTLQPKWLEFEGMATGERRKGERVVFERGIPAHMMGIDGTWRRDCIMEDVSEMGAKLTVDGSVEGLQLKEFFLLLSSTGLAYRRCELAWVNGDQIGVTFLKPGKKKKTSRHGAEV
jgi:hypothetical protein